jgi:hypothetical protein
MRDLVVFCADVGSVKSGNFGRARTEPDPPSVIEYDSSSPADLASAVAHELLSDRPVALGFECPLFVPVPDLDSALGAAREGEGNRAWSAGAGTGALATGLVQAAWVLRAVRVRCPNSDLHLTWSDLCASEQGLLIWEAFISAGAKGSTHVDDATIAVEAFSAALPDPSTASAIKADRPLSLAGTVGLWSGWLDEPMAVHQAPLVIRAAR